MAKYCGSCGSQVSDTSPFCESCGAKQNLTTPVPVPVQPAYTQVNASAIPSSYPPPPPTKSSGSGIKIIVAILAVLFVGALLAAGALFYVGHRVASKIKAAAVESGLSLHDDSGTASASAPFQGDPCLLLSKDDVSTAIGITIVATQSTAAGCNYMAQGSSSDMTARHLSAMMATKGADSQAQDMMHKLAGGLFTAQQKDSKDQTLDSNGTVPVVVFAIDTNNAREQMKLNSKVLGALGGGASSGAIEGVGDEAFDSAGGMMFIRKGDKLISITYMMCPCTIEAIKPLARKLADAV
jgi:hypothetical protein